jgi:hypothetical protein
MRAFEWWKELKYSRLVPWQDTGLELRKHYAMVVQDRLFYLASPYSHEDAKVRATRFDAVCLVAGKLYEAAKPSVATFCPIGHSHPIEVALMARDEKPAPRSWDYWLPWDFKFMPALSGMLVACLPGWQESTGISIEGPKFLHWGMPVVLLDVRDMFEDDEWKKLGGVA